MNHKFLGASVEAIIFWMGVTLFIGIIILFCFGTGLAPHLVEYLRNNPQEFGVTTTEVKAQRIHSCMDEYRLSEETCARILFPND